MPGCELYSIGRDRRPMAMPEGPPVVVTPRPPFVCGGVVKPAFGHKLGFYPSHRPVYKAILFCGRLCGNLL